MRKVAKKEELKGKLIKPTLSFFGGEPTLCWSSVIVPLVEYIETEYPNKIQMGITTNGILLNQKRIDFLAEHNIIPLLSMDGASRTQDFNRPFKDGKGSFEVVERNIPYLLKKFPNTTFRMTVYEPTAKYLFDNVLYAESKGFNNFYCIPDTRHNFSDKGLYELEEELRKIFTYFTGCLMLQVIPITSSIINNAFIEALGTSEGGSSGLRDIGRCGLGTTSIAVAPNGDLYGCQEQIGLNNKFLLGTVYNGVNSQKHKELLDEYHSLRAVKCE